jgi:hydrogenase maturation factor HypF (carbamoyltransferase family)
MLPIVPRSFNEKQMTKILLIYSAILPGACPKNRNRNERKPLIQRLQEENFTLLLAEKIPYNDAGLSYGQIVEAFYHAR